MNVIIDVTSETFEMKERIQFAPRSEGGKGFVTGNQYYIFLSNLEGGREREGEEEEVSSGSWP